MAVTWKKLAYEDNVITKALLTTAGDVIYASGASTPARLGIGGAGNLLTVSAGLPAWAAPGAPAAHAATHQDAGADEISVAALSGLLADGQTPLAHAASHKTAGADVIKLNEFGVPVAAVDFDLKQATDLVVMTVATIAAKDAIAYTAAAVGQLLFVTATLDAWVCTVSVV